MQDGRASLLALATWPVFLAFANLVPPPIAATDASGFTEILTSSPMVASWCYPERRRVGLRSPMRYNARAVGLRCRVGRAHSSASRLPRERRGVVDGCCGGARRALRPGRRHRKSATGSVVAACRYPDRSTLDLNALTAIGGTWLVAWLVSAKAARLTLQDRCVTCARSSDLEMVRLLDLIDEWARENGLDETVEPPHRFPPTRVEDTPPLGMDLATGEIKTIIWATGYRPDYSWLELPVLDRKG